MDNIHSETPQNQNISGESRPDSDLEMVLQGNEEKQHTATSSELRTGGGHENAALQESEVMEVSSETEERLLGEPKDSATSEETTGVAEARTGETEPKDKTKKRKLSGAQIKKRRRERKLREEQEKAAEGKSAMTTNPQTSAGTPTATTGEQEKGKPPSKPANSNKKSGAAKRKQKKAGSSQPQTDRLRELQLKGQTSKRGRSDSSTPDSAKNTVPNKRWKDQPGPSFSGVVTSIKMAVVPKDYPKSRLSEKEMELVQQALLARIEPDSESKPQFQGTKFEQGALMLYCRNLVTKIWLQDKTATLVPWEGAELKAVLAKDLIVSCRVIFEAPAELKKAKPSEILEKIEGQNGGLLTKDWKVIHSKETTKGQTLVCVVDMASLAVLEARKMVIYIGFNSVRLTNLDKKKAGNEDRADQSA